MASKPSQHESVFPSFGFDNRRTRREKSWRCEGRLPDYQLRIDCSSFQEALRQGKHGKARTE